MDSPRPTTCLLCVLTLALAFSGTAHGQGVRWTHDLQAARQNAQTHGRLLLLKFTADWCGYCKKMERTTFADPPTAALVNREFIPVLIDADQHQDLLQQFAVEGLPALLVVTPEMRVVERISGYRTAEKLTPILQAATTKHRPTIRYADSSAAHTRFDSPPIRDAPDTDFAKIENSLSIPPTPPPSTSVPQPTPPQSPSVRQQMLHTPAFGGLCLTSVVDTRSIVKGDPAHSMVYRGQTLWFRDRRQRDAFRRSPRKYWPMLDGLCGMTLLQTGRQVPGKLEHAAVFRKRVWLFSSSDQMSTFIKSPAEHASRFKASSAERR